MRIKWLHTQTHKHTHTHTHTHAHTHTHTYVHTHTHIHPHTHTHTHTYTHAHTLKATILCHRTFNWGSNGQVPFEIEWRERTNGVYKKKYWGKRKETCLIFAARSSAPPCWDSDICLCQNETFFVRERHFVWERDIYVWEIHVVCERDILCVFVSVWGSS